MILKNYKKILNFVIYTNFKICSGDRKKLLHFYIKSKITCIHVFHLGTGLDFFGVEFAEIRIIN